MTLFRLYICLLFCLYSVTSVSQQYNIRQYSLEEGLPQSEVNAIAEDQFGYLWLGTNGGGLCRFNGRTFEIFTKQDGLNDNIIFGLFFDHRYDLWITTSKGVMRYDGKEFHRVFQSDTLTIRNDVALCEYPAGTIWAHLTTTNDLRMVLRIKDSKTEKLSDIFPEFNKKAEIINMHSLQHRGLLLGTTKGVYHITNNQLKPLVDERKMEQAGYRILLPRLSDRNNNLYFVGYRNNAPATLLKMNTQQQLEKIQLPEEISPGRIGRGYEDRNGSLWFPVVGTGVINLQNNQWKVFTENNGLPNSFVNRVIQDQEGNIWLATLGGGLLRYNGDMFVSFDEQSGLRNNIVRQIFQTSKGDIYITDSKGGLSHFDGKKIQELTDPSLQKAKMITNFVEISPGRVLAATLSGLYWFDGKKLTSASKEFGLEEHAPCLGILKERDNIWISIYGNGVIKRTKNQNQSFNTSNSEIISDHINTLFADSKGRIWMGSQNGASCFENEKFKNFLEGTELLAPWVVQFAEDKAGNTWMATYPGGLVQVSGKGIFHLNKSNGLSSDMPYSIIADNEGNLYAGMQNGIDKITLDATGNVVSIVNFDKYDGFTGIENNSGANLLDAAGNLWFGTIKGAIRFNPGEKRINHMVPPVFLRKIFINHQETKWSQAMSLASYDSLSTWFNLPQNLRLKRKVNHIGFAFDALCFSAPEKVQYQWRLDPIETEWTPANTSDFSSYPSLPPGNYTLYVKAANNNGIWNEEGFAYAFTITPAWYQTLWFKFFVLLFLGLVISLLILQWNHRNKRHKMELEMLVTRKTTEIQKQKQVIENKNQQLEQQQQKLIDQQQSITNAYKDLERLTEIGKAVTANLSAERIFELVYNAVGKVMQADLFGFALKNEPEKTLEYEHAILMGERLPFIRFALDDKRQLSVKCLTENKEVVVQQRIENEGTQKISREETTTQSAIYIPLRTSGNPFGVVTVQSLQQDAYTEYHINFVRNIANYTSIALENAEAFEKLANQQHILEEANKNMLVQKEELIHQQALTEQLNNKNEILLNSVCSQIKEPLAVWLKNASALNEELLHLPDSHREIIVNMVDALKKIEEMIH
jgi:ligand-binding sensor domain-containing protein/GAF domain-containing protein